MNPAVTTNIMNSILLVLAALSLACGPASRPVESQPLLDGVWEGQIEMLVMRKRIIVHFANEQGKLRATMDAPTSFTKGFPLRDLEVKAATLRFSIPLGAGLRSESGEWRHLPLLVPGNANEGGKLVFEGKIEGDSIRGKTAGIPFPGAFHLRRSRVQTQAPASPPLGAEWSRKERDYWPTREWKTATPAAEGIDPRGLAEAERVILENKPEVRSLLVIRRGRLVYEKYFRGASGNQAFNVKSVTKSFTSALTGIALRERLLRGLDEKVSDLLPEYFAAQTDARKKQITLRHLLTMTAGFEWIENGPVTAAWIESADHAKFTFDLPLVADPGKGYTYNTGLSHLLSVIITRQSKMSLLEFARRRLFAPLGIKALSWDTDPQGFCEGGSELHLTARDMARFGFLYLNAGQWEGKEIVPAEWVRESLRPHAAKDPLWADYGYQWWIGQDDELPSFSAFGYGGQVIHITPK
ncbi:MAG: serine hydrolase domain-containing protein [Blastocatellia bacterium]